MRLFVSTDGNDSNPGTLERPLASLHQAKLNIREIKNKYLQLEPIDVLIRKGVYELAEPLVFTSEDSGSEGSPIYYRAYPGECVTISGGRSLKLPWKPYRDGIWSAQLGFEELGKAEIDQLYVNGLRQICARFPNYNPEDPLMAGSGYIHAAGGTDKLPDKELRFHAGTFTANHWSNPSTGIVHVFQSHYWGNMQYRIKEIDWEQKQIQLGDGGFQLQCSYGINENSRFYVENIWEELDAEGEWFYDKIEGVLYYYPPAETDLQRADIAISRLEQLIEFRGVSSDAVSHVTMEGLAFTQTRSTFMKEYEDLARGDWSIHRGGAVFMEGAADCNITNCYFENIGGNGVFLSGFNRRNTVAGCKFERVGESAVCLVGSPRAVRMYQTWLDEETERRPKLDLKAGPLNGDYPEACSIRNNIIRDIGIYGKQTAGVFISMSSRVSVSCNTIYEVPRAAICINDGTWGGHVIEHNDIWETVRETGEHGPFNSWGRDRHWSAQSQAMNKEAVFRDAMEPVRIRNNRIANYRKSVSAGNWTIDLDDGSSNYFIYNNLCLGSTLKLRDGYYRMVENNIFVSPVPIGWHVWPKGSEDVFTRNIVVVAGTRPGDIEPADAMIAPIRMPEHPWGKLINFNLYWNVNTRRFLVKELPAGRLYDWEAWRSLGYDINSICGDPLFTDPGAGDYRIEADSPAWDLGFKSFPLDQFGHRQTRIEPFGGEFEQSIQVMIRRDERGGEVWYTKDGNEPYPGSPSSRRYDGLLSLEETVTIKAATFKENIAQGFTQTVVFTKVNKLSHPDWLTKLLSLDGAYENNLSIPEQEVLRHIFLGATMTDIRDGDVIDALGGYNRGVLLAEVPNNSEAYARGLRRYDVVIECNGMMIETLLDFKRKSRFPDQEIKDFLVFRGYKKIKIP